MKKVTKYQSDSGVLYDTELEALRADADFHKERARKLDQIEAERRDAADRRRAQEGGSYAGGHQ